MSNHPWKHYYGKDAQRVAESEAKAEAETRIAEIKSEERLQRTLLISWAAVLIAGCIAIAIVTILN